MDRSEPASSLTGLLVLLVGVGHVLLAGILFANQLADIASANVVAAVSFDERTNEQAAAVWFTVNGVLLIALGQLARAYQQQAGRLPGAPGWLLIGLGAAGAIVAPIAGFWVYIGLGALWLSDSRA